MRTEKAGYEVKWIPFQTGPHAMQEMAVDGLDFVVCGATPIMNAPLQRSARPIILAGANREGSSLVVDPSIEAVNDMEGKRIGTPGLNSLQYTMLTQWARTNGIPLRIESLAPAGMPDALQKKEIQGFIAWAPHPAKAVALGIGRELLTSHDMMPGHQCCVLATRENVIADSPETVDDLLKAYLEAYRWFLANQDESIRMMAKETNMDEAIIRRALATVQYLDPPWCDTDSMEKIAQGLIEAKKDEAGEINPAAFIRDLYRPERLEAISNARRPAPAK